MATRGQSNHSKYLASSHWKKTRKRFNRKRIARTCFVCGVGRAKGSTLDVHHLTYARIGREQTSDLVALCRNHHKLVHENHKMMVATKQSGEAFAAPGFKKASIHSATIYTKREYERERSSREAADRCRLQQKQDVGRKHHAPSLGTMLRREYSAIVQHFRQI